ncbi:PREDICTED: uncharacterized protein LOC104818723 [Tarenaya hassleriana]|uniref:uncharacterized protein LOC104818723 n=1 Tax=Tarenaya hassleriana TaxID=28532 RepID=UPI00053C6482|nr:PREDICTED: uncharacterized protein LOC104818723 [Tarenaya hassleriana]
MGLGNDAKKCSFGDNGLADDGRGGADCDSRDGDGRSGSVACSICLDMVAVNGDRSWATLQCGHRFHLDCIGSAFNAKGMMQCPNCRKIEKGQWLYANGCRSFPEFPTMDDLVHEEEMSELAAQSEVSFGVHWCPFGSLALLPSFEDGEFSPSSYHDLLARHGFFTEPTASSAGGQPCPYIAYFGPVHHPSASNSASDSSSFSSIWNSASSGVGEVPMPFGFGGLDPHFHGWDYHPAPPPPPPFSGSGAHIGSPPQPTASQVAPRTSRTSSDVNRPRPPHYMRPFLGHSSGGRAGSSAAAPRAPPYPGSSARNRDRVQALQAYYQQSPAQSHPHPSEPPAVSRAPPAYPSGRRSSRGISSGMGSVASSSDQAGAGGGFIRFNIWERDQFLQPTQPVVSGNQIDRDSSSRWTSAFPEGSGSFHQRHGGGSS